MSDAYHSCYVLSGLSSAQHQWELDGPADVAAGGDAAATAAEAAWTVFPYLDGPQVFASKDRVRPIHPVYAIPQQNVRAIQQYFQAKQGF